MARGVELRNHPDAALPRITQDFHILFPGVEGGIARAAIGRGFESLGLLQVPVRELVMAAEGRQLRQAGNLQAPGLIVSQVEMEEVQLVGSHNVQHLQNLFLAAEIPHHIQHKAAEAQVRPVFNNRVREALGKLFQGGLRKECAILIIGLHRRLPLIIETNLIPAGRMGFPLKSPSLHLRNDVRGLGLVGGGKEAGVDGRSLAVQEVVLHRDGLVGLSLPLQHKSLRSPGVAGQRTAQIGYGKRSSLGKVQIAAGALEMLDFLNGTTRNLVIVKQFLEPDAPVRGHIAKLQRMLCASVFSYRSFRPYDRRLPTGPKQDQGQQ